MQLEYHDLLAGRLLRLIENARTRSKKAKTKFALDRAWVDTVARQKSCAITGMPLDVTSPLVDGHAPPLAPSLDRIDRRKGYTPDNVRIVSYFANVARNVWTDTELKLLIMVAATSLKT